MVIGIVAFAIVLAGCSRELSPKEHLAVAMEMMDDDEQLALAIWHLQQYLDTEPQTTEEKAEAELVKVHLRSCIDRFFRNHPPSVREADLSRIRDLEMKIDFLEAQNAQQKGWITRVNAENQQLREKVIMMQKK